MNAIKAKDAPRCCSRSVMLLADGELDPSHTLEVESHLTACEPCRSQLELIRSMRASLRRSCTRRAPSSMEARMLTALEAAPRPGVVEARASEQDTRAAVAWKTGGGRARARTAAIAGAVAVAACFVVVVVLRSQQSAPRSFSEALAVPDPTALAKKKAANDESLDALLDDLVSQHANPLPPEERNPEDLTRLEPYVGVPVRRPALSVLRYTKDSPSFDGARIHALRDSRTAAALQYKLKGHRLTVYVFDPHKIPLKLTRLKPRVVRETPAPVYVGNMRGFSVAAAERSGVGYAIASDLDEDKNIQMVASF
ncbi:MAG: zf-HC2 domain-containing protein [Polyangiaceae bacterium]|jgi:negative regulator of sigma E activity|nr:zf-HC2 domain-containing protein [Polyangiaceae bacterium]MBK8939593.1 zf-HC2 domain-containing protein [Polyangiaceae bacterium]